MWQQKYAIIASYFVCKAKCFNKTNNKVFFSFFIQTLFPNTSRSPNILSEMPKCSDRRVPLYLIKLIWKRWEFSCIYSATKSSCIYGFPDNCENSEFTGKFRNNFFFLLFGKINFTKDSRGCWFRIWRFPHQPDYGFPDNHENTVFTGRIFIFSFRLIHSQLRFSTKLIPNFSVSATSWLCFSG